jgi:hypothetical protein
VGTTGKCIDYRENITVTIILHCTVWPWVVGVYSSGYTLQLGIARAHIILGVSKQHPAGHSTGDSSSLLSTTTSTAAAVVPDSKIKKFK